MSCRLNTTLQGTRRVSTRPSGAEPLGELKWTDSTAFLGLEILEFQKPEWKTHQEHSKYSSEILKGSLLNFWESKNLFTWVLFCLLTFTVREIKNETSKNTHSFHNENKSTPYLHKLHILRKNNCIIWNKTKREITMHVLHVRKLFKGLPQLKISGSLYFSLHLVLCNITCHAASGKVHWTLVRNWDKDKYWVTPWYLS